MKEKRITFIYREVWGSRESEKEGEKKESCELTERKSDEGMKKSLLNCTERGNEK